jgi:hypothetical protein
LVAKIKSVNSLVEKSVVIFTLCALQQDAAAKAVVAAQREPHAREMEADRVAHVAAR